MNNMYESSKKVQKNSEIYLMVYIVYFVALFIWGIYKWENSFLIGWEKAIFPWIVLSLIINLVGFIFVKKVRYIDAGLLYVFFSYFFMFGHIFNNVSNLKTTLTWNPAIYFSDSVKFKASIYVLFCLTAVSFGCLFIKRSSKVEVNINETELIKHRYIMARCGWFLVLIGFTANAINSGKIIVATITSGSYASYTAANTTGVIDDIAYLVVPGIVYLQCSRTLSKRKKFLLLIISVLYFIITMVLSGSRKTQVFAILVIILCFLWTQKKKFFTLGRIILLLILGILFLNLIYVIRENRFNLTTIIPKYLESLGSFKFVGAIAGETFAEAGLSFYSIVAIIDNVPSNFPYEMGMTLVRTLPSVLPIGWIVGDFFNKAASSNVINRFTNLPVGTSLLGDFYWNWGLFGGIISGFIFGIIISKISKKTIETFDDEPVYFSVLYILLIGIRAGIFEIFRPLVMVTVIPYILRLVLYGRKRYFSKEG